MNNLIINSNKIRGSRINQYILLNEIGRGGHGVVYQGYHDTKPNEPLAIKIIEDTGNLDLLLIEPELLSLLNHPNIIRLKDYFIHAGKLVIVTEYINGINLQSYLEQRGRLTVSEVINFLTQMADALVNAHANNIIHRDIKLSNILVIDDNKNLRFVLVDFGISRMAEGIQTVKRIAGTYYYMAPEQLRGRPCEQSDLWALGVCAYTLLTGIKPFEAKLEEELSHKILFSIPQAPSEIIETIEPELENIIFHLLEKQLINRITCANELLNELKRLFRLSTKHKIPKKKINEPNSVTHINTWEQKNLKEIQINWVKFWILVFLATVPYFIVGDIISISGLFLFFIGQEKRKKFYTLSSVIVIFSGLLVSINVQEKIFNIILDVNQAENASLYSMIQLIQLLVSLPFTLASTHHFIKIRRLKEDLLLHKMLREFSQNREKIINLIKNFVDIHWGNMNVHQKYIELLFLDKRFEEAIVESKLALYVDPYNFAATLFLANGYFEVGLYEKCIEVCNGYLSVSNYSFEFSDMKEKCEKFLEG
ncbi:protein kinase domain-containing protein [Nostoc sp. CCY 9925]|uniref:serine/threonine-protein kinase n=1 Tax=Nostoc sp. CCY 9925 TaxID=3103865 RepID=UPI0039C695CA